MDLTNNEQSASTDSRRNFIKTVTLASAGFMIVPRHVLGKGFLAPSDRLQVAAVGVGGKGFSNVNGIYDGGKSDMAFLCDVDTRSAAAAVKKFPSAKFYKDYREMLDKDAKNIDAVIVSTPDHNHAMIAVAAMQLGKHVYVEKPLTHDIYEARKLTDAGSRFKVVTQMGNQGSSGDGVRQMMDWIDAGVIGKVERAYCWTNRPIWPQGIPWPANPSPVPAELDWDLWLGSAQFKPYADKVVPFSWRGWWDYGTGAIGDMGAHLLEPPVRILRLSTPTAVQCSVGSIYVDKSKRGYFPDSCPPSSSITLSFAKTDKTKDNFKIHWLDGGIKPPRPDELAPNEPFGDNGVLLEGTRGKMICDTYGANPRLLPLSRTNEVHVKQRAERVPGGVIGHYSSFVEACKAGYGQKKLSSPFEIAGPLTETMLVANLAVRATDLQIPKADGTGVTYPGRELKLLWDHENMRVTNFDEVNRFVRREYRSGWSLGI